MLPSPEDIQAFRQTVERGIPHPLAPSPALTQLFAHLGRSERCLRELEEKRLAVAFFGGTGVGKSTLLNAVAGRTISRVGDRRPTTDRVVCYRHRDVPVPDWLDPEDLADPSPPPHAVLRLRGVILLDLPDIDSRDLSHRALVHRLLPRLDLLIVVTNTDKYGDKILYDEITAFPQSPRNLIFVLNTIDRLSPVEVPVIRTDFLEKLTRFSPVEKPVVYALSALRALETPHDPGAGSFQELREDLDQLDDDAERRSVLTANATASLAQAARSWEVALPPDRIERWLELLRAIPCELPDPPTALGEALRSHLVDTIWPWVSDRGLRGSWFPIGPLYFLLRRFRPARTARRTENPFSGGRDPCADFTERVLTRPIRLAAHQVRAARRASHEGFVLELPELAEREIDPEFVRTQVAPWWERLGKRSSQWTWKVRQHVVPALLGLVWGSWVCARALERRAEGASGWAAVVEAVTAVGSTFSPITLALAAGGLILYYLSVYPYYLYWIERAVHREANQGAHVYLASWTSAFEHHWGRPFRSRLDATEQWWGDVQRSGSRLRPGDGSTVPPGFLDTTRQ